MAFFGGLLIVAFIALGIFGGMCAYSRWVRGYQGWLIFEPLPAMYFGVALLLTLMGSIAGFREYNAWNGSLLLLAMALFPFGFVGAVMWVFALGLETGSRVMTQSFAPLPRTFDRGDGAMARGKYADAEREYRTAVELEPHNNEALMRLIRALEAQGQLKQAAEELSAAHQRIIEHRNDGQNAAANSSTSMGDRWQERLLAVTFALGDLYTSKLEEPQRALSLYNSSLEYLYGYKDADSLRARLKRIEHGYSPISNSTDPLPHRLPLE